MNKWTKFKSFLGRLSKRFVNYRNGILKRIIWLRSLKVFQPPKKKLNFYNSCISKNEIRELRNEIFTMIHFDSYLFHRLTSIGLKGLKAWEYGKILNFIESWKNLKVLDVGSGSSTFPLFLKTKGAKVYSIDYPEPIEKQDISFRKELVENLYYVNGNALSLPFKDNSFDIVTCISTIEHLDTDENLNIFSKKEFLNRTKTCLLEIMRVIKSGGFLYLTTDAYHQYLQKEDNWSAPIKYPTIGSAYKFSEVNTIFKTIEDNNFKFIGQKNFCFDDIEKSNKYENYRGRYFTTFSILAQKGG